MTLPRGEGAGGLAPPTVRPARRNDVGPLGAFFVHAWKESGPDALGFTGATEEAVKEIASEGFLSKRLSNPKMRILVAERAGRIVGFASVRGGVEGGAELSGIVVLKEESGKGVGTRLVRKACGAARGLGFGKIAVKTEAFNERAIRFYKENGFTESGRTTEKVGRTMVPIQTLLKRLS